MGVEKWKKQSYNKIKKQCVSSSKLWDDPLFPPNDSSLALTKSSYSNVVWKRPSVRVFCFTIKRTNFTNKYCIEGIVPESKIICGESELKGRYTRKSW